MPRGMTSAELRRYAAVGAQAEIERLRSRIAELQRMFPASATTSGAATTTVRRRHRMSAAGRAKIAAAAKKRWAEWHRTKKEKAATTKAAKGRKATA